MKAPHLWHQLCGTNSVMVLYTADSMQGAGRGIKCVIAV